MNKCIDIEIVYDTINKVRPLGPGETKDSRMEEIKKRANDNLFFSTPDLRRVGWIKKPVAVKDIKKLRLPDDANIYDICDQKTKNS